MGQTYFGPNRVLVVRAPAFSVCLSLSSWESWLRLVSECARQLSRPSQTVDCHTSSAFKHGDENVSTRMSSRRAAAAAAASELHHSNWPSPTVSVRSDSRWWSIGRRWWHQLFRSPAQHSDRFLRRLLLVALRKCERRCPTYSKSTDGHAFIFLAKEHTLQ